MGKINKIIVVGAGPAGLLLALQLARNGIHVEVVELASKLDEQPRATHYGPPAVYELRRAGVYDEVLRQGFVMRSVAWRKLDGTFLAALSGEDLPEDYPYKITCLPLNRLAAIMYDSILKQGNVAVSWSHKVIGLGQDEQRAWVEVETSVGKKTSHADFIVGCDGANSQIRRSLFDDKTFPGHTSTSIGKGTGRDALWRITYGDTAGLTHAEYLARQPEKFAAFLPGHPTPDTYTVTNISPYEVHQRCAPKLHVGRFLLAADAAHLCNPFGGLGLTGGIVHVSGLINCLVGIHTGRADADAILDRYSDVRRDKYHSIVNPVSSDNILRLWGQDPDEALERDEFLKMCKRAEVDKAVSRRMQEGAMALQHDFTQYYHEGDHKAPAEKESVLGSVPVSEEPAPLIAAVAVE